MAWPSNMSFTEGDVGLPVLSSSSCLSREHVCSAAATTAAPASGDKSLPYGAIAVISVGAVVAMAAAVTVGVVCGLRCARQRRQQWVVEEALKLSTLACTSEEELTDVSEGRMQQAIKVSESRGSLTSFSPRSTSFAGVAVPCFTLEPAVAAAGTPGEAISASPMPCVFLGAAPRPMSAVEGYADLENCYPFTAAAHSLAASVRAGRGGGVKDEECDEVLAVNSLSLQAVACLPSLSSLVESRAPLLQHPAHDTSAAPPVADANWDAALCAR